MRESYVVICLEEKLPPASEWESSTQYELATRTVFDSLHLARWYASTIAPERKAMVISGRFAELRFDSYDRFGKHAAEESK